MKVFALITAGLMATGAGAYFLHTDSVSNCPVAKSGGCCVASQAKTPSCCAIPCSGCAEDCSDCCAVCEECCTAGVQAPVSVAKPDCCVTGADCCVSACCTGVVTAVKQPAATEGCCSFCEVPSVAATATAAATAGVVIK